MSLSSNGNWPSIGVDPVLYDWIEMTFALSVLGLVPHYIKKRSLTHTAYWRKDFVSNLKSSYLLG